MAEDREFPEKDNLGAADGVIGLASPKDRLAAYVLDCTLLLPLVQIVQSPFKKWILESFLFNETADVSMYRMANLFIFVFLFVAYYTLMIWWKGQTLGKMFFGVKVISYMGNLTFFHALSRALSIFLEFLCLGFPFLAIFSHNLRRPIHDRVADTLVISVKNPVSFPSPQEVNRVQWVSGLYGFVVGLSVLIYILLPAPERDDKLSKSELEECREKGDLVNNDLETILELSIVKSISQECLFELARDLTWKQGESALSQFAMASALRHDEQQAAPYLKSICKVNKNHHLCAFTQWLGQEDKSSQSLMTFLTKIRSKKPMNFVRVLLAGLAREKRDYILVDKILEPVQGAGVLQPVVANLSFHSLLGQLKWDEAFWLYRTHDGVGDKSLLLFMQQQMEQSFLSTKQQLQLLDMFYPSLGDRSSGREPASTHNIPAEIKDIYNLLEGRL